MGRAQEYLERTYGFPVTSFEHTETLNAVTPVQVTLNDPNRCSVIILNLSANNVYLAFNSGVGIANGILLAANGGQVGFNIREDGDLPTKQIYAISAAGVPVIYLNEMVALR